MGRLRHRVYIGLPGSFPTRVTFTDFALARSDRVPV